MTEIQQRITDEGESIRIKMVHTVHPFFVFQDKGFFLQEGKEYEGITNPHGAISGICPTNGKSLGVKPEEFVFLTAPLWVLDKWRKMGGLTGFSAKKLFEERMKDGS